MHFNTHSGLGSKGRIGTLWTFSTKEYTIQACITAQICTAWLQTEIASLRVCAHVHASGVRRTHCCCRPTTSPQVQQGLHPHPPPRLPLRSENNTTMTSQERASASDKKKRKQKSPLSLCDPSHLVRPGEGFLHTVLPCSAVITSMLLSL